MCMTSMDNILALFLMAMKADHPQKIRSILGDSGDIQQSESMKALVNQEAFLSNRKRWQTFTHKKTLDYKSDYH